MTPAIQLVLTAETPVFDYINQTANKEDLLSFTSTFIQFLNQVQEMDAKLHLKLALVPIYFEILDQASFQEEMTDYLQKRKLEHSAAYNFWRKNDGKLLLVLRHLVKQKKLEVLAGPATNCIVPYLTTEMGLNSQIQTGISIIEDYFEEKPKGFWLPEGAYAPGIDLHLILAGIEYSYLNSQTTKFADPPPPMGEHQPISSPHGLVFFPIHQEQPANWYLNQVSNDSKTGQRESIQSLQLDLSELVVSLIEERERTIFLLDQCIPYDGFKQLLKVPNEYPSHLCSAFRDADVGTTELLKGATHLWSESHFIEGDLESLVPHIVTEKEQLAFREMVKEWMLLVGTISCRSLNRIELAEKYIHQYRKLKSMLTSKEMASATENGLPILEGIHLDKKHVEYSTKKKILVLSWEFPPNVVGGLARHVHGLTSNLTNLGYEIHVITTQTDDLPAEEIVDGVVVHRVKPINEKEHDFLYWIGGLNLALTMKANQLSLTHDFLMIHAHDWLVGAAALSLKEQLNIPLVSTIHATEHGRNNGIYTEMQKFIHNKERTLIQESDCVIVCSKYMKEEIIRLFGVDEMKVEVVPNGVDLSASSHPKHSQVDLPMFHDKRMIFSLGRMVKEKGFDTLIESAPLLLEKYPDVYLVIAGKGPMLEEYRRRVRESGLEASIYFIGYVDDHKRDILLDECEIAVFPSRYEPFGIVALESMIFGKPTIVSETGGLKGIVQHLKTGLWMKPDSPESFFEQASILLDDPDFAREIGENGKQVIKKLYSWRRIAEETRRVFEEALLNYRL